MDCDGADEAGEQGRAKGLCEDVVAELRQPAPQRRAGAGAEGDEKHSQGTGGAEDHAEPRRASGRHKYETGERCELNLVDRGETRSNRGWVDETVLGLLDDAHRRRNSAHMDAERLYETNPRE